MKNSRLVIILLVSCLVFSVVSCAPRKTKTTVDRIYELDPWGSLYVNPAFISRPPKRIAVLPFKSLVGEGRVEWSKQILLGLRNKERPASEELAQEMRMVFFGQLSQLPFEEMHPIRIDAVLREKGLLSWDTLQALKPAQLRSLLPTDAVVFGEVTHFDYVYGFLYTQLAVGLRLKMISTATGEILWRFDDTRRDHTLRVALDPISLAVGLFQAGFSLRPINMTRSMDEICREAVGHIPVPFGW